MEIKNYSFTAILIISLIVSLFILNNKLYSFNIADIEIEINLENELKTHRTFIINCGNKENSFLNNGTIFSIFRESEDGILNHIGNLETVSVGGITCKAKLKTLSSSLKERTLGINNIAIGDIANPSITIPITELFKNLSSEKLTKKGEEEIENQVLPMINTGEFEKIKIYTFLNRGLSSNKEIYQASIISEDIKKNLIIKHGIPEEFIEIHNIANYQNLFEDKFKTKNSRIEFVFISSEKNENYAIVEDNSTTTNNENEDFDLDELDLDEELKEFEMESNVIKKPTEISGPQEITNPKEQEINLEEEQPDTTQPGTESFK